MLFNQNFFLVKKLNSSFSRVVVFDSCIAMIRLIHLSNKLVNNNDVEKLEFNFLAKKKSRLNNINQQKNIFWQTPYLFF